MDMQLIIMLILILFVILSYTADKRMKTGLNYGKKGKRLPKNVEIFRELPCGKDIYRAYWLAVNYDLIDNKSNFLGTILLKWLKQGKIIITSEKKGIFNEENITISFSSGQKFDIELEEELYEYMHTASRDGLLKSNEFKRWLYNHYEEIFVWFNKILDYQKTRFKDEGKILLKADHSANASFFSYDIDESLYDEAIKMKGLKKFFDEFENIQDKKIIEINLLDEYLMYAQLFGNAEEVAKQFKKTYPDVEYEYYKMNFINSMVRSALGYATAGSILGGMNNNDEKTDSDIFSSGGGGGGSFGSGGGGGFR